MSYTISYYGLRNCAALTINQLKVWVLVTLPSKIEDCEEIFVSSLWSLAKHGRTQHEHSLLFKTKRFNLASFQLQFLRRRDNINYNTFIFVEIIGNVFTLIQIFSCGMGSGKCFLLSSSLYQLLTENGH